MARQDTDQQRRTRIAEVLEEGAQLRRATLDRCGDAIAAAAGVLVAGLEAGHRVLAFGNGGSASDAQHFAAELAGRYERDRIGLPALALTANSSDLTAIGNDFGFDRVFARLVEAHGRTGDVAFAISTSGDSPNVLEGVAEARARGMASIGLIGRGGGKLAGAVDVPIVVPSERTARIQEVHIAIIHLLCELVDEELFPARDVD
jgi:D-sedoheptulose 7-phosphate isomerase